MVFVPLYLRSLFAAGLFSFLVVTTSMAQEPKAENLVRPIEGTRLILGEGGIPDCVLNCFVHLCHEATPHVVVICVDGQPRASVDRWKQCGIPSPHFVDSIPTDMNSLTKHLLRADGVWIEGSAEALRHEPLILALIANVAEKQGIIAMGSSIVPLISIIEQSGGDASVDGLQSPLARCKFHIAKDGEINLQHRGAESLVHWSVPNSTALLFHHGRRVTAYGANDVTVIAKKPGGLMRKQSFETIDVFSVHDVPSYSVDLLSWVRTAADATKPPFPPENAPVPTVSRGTLVLHGGSGVNDVIFSEFIAAAGGKDAPIVCIPSSSRFESYEEPGSYSAERLAELGCNNVKILHTDDPLVATKNNRFLEPLRNAQGVWIDGGRTYRFMDCYENTPVQELIQKVLERDGAVGGSSAGCQVAGDFLVRGNPRSNKDIVHDGYTRGLGLIRGVILDAHFLQRDRHQPFMGLMQHHPQMLGIGIDEKTALIVNGHAGRVAGANAVSFYNFNKRSTEESAFVILQSGESYDLKIRRKIK